MKNNKQAKKVVLPIALSLVMVAGILPVSANGGNDLDVKNLSGGGTLATPSDVNDSEIGTSLLPQKDDSLTQDEYDRLLVGTVMDAFLEGREDAQKMYDELSDELKALVKASLEIETGEDNNGNGVVGDGLGSVSTYPETLPEEIIEVQEMIDDLPELEDFISTQRDEVKPLLVSIREEMKSLSDEDEELLNVDKLVNLEAAVQMVIAADYYEDEQIGGIPVFSTTDVTLVFEDLGDKILAKPVFDDDSQYLAAVEGAGHRYNTYQVIENEGKRNETYLGLSFTKGKKWSSSISRFRIGVKTNYMHPMTVKENVDGTWGAGTLEPTLSLVKGEEMDIVPKMVEGYRYYTIITKDMRGNQQINMDMEAAGLSQPDKNGVMHWKSSITAPNYTGYIFNYYKLIRTVNYDANGGSGTMANGSYVSKEKFAVAANSFVRDGYKFVGWNTAADGTGTAYSADEVVVMPLVESLTLYAQWEEAENPSTPVDPTPDRPTPRPEPEEEIEEDETPEVGGDEEEIEDEATPEIGGEEEEIEDEATPEAGNKDVVTDTGVASTLPWMVGLITSAIVAVGELFKRRQK